MHQQTTFDCWFTFSSIHGDAHCAGNIQCNLMRLQSFWPELNEHEIYVWDNFITEFVLLAEADWNWLMELIYLNVVYNVIDCCNVSHPQLVASKRIPHPFCGWISYLSIANTLYFEQHLFKFAYHFSCYLRKFVSLQKRLTISRGAFSLFSRNN